jgi:hypothetical protein
VLNFSEIGHQLKTRFDLLAATRGPLSDYVKTQIDPLLCELSMDHSEVGQVVLTLSPSDFGAHNLLWDEITGRMKCIDLEFFGWDDAHKLTCDSLLHPLAHWTDECAEAFLLGAVETYKLDEGRLKWLWPLLNLKWAAITLSRSERNLLAGDQALANQALHRAEIYIAHAGHAPDSLFDIVQQAKSKRGRQS